MIDLGNVLRINELTGEQGQSGGALLRQNGQNPETLCGIISTLVGNSTYYVSNNTLLNLVNVMQGGNNPQINLQQVQLNPNNNINIVMFR